MTSFFDHIKVYAQNYIKKPSSWFLLGLVIFIFFNFYLGWQVTNSQKFKIENTNKKVLIFRKNVQGGFSNSYLALSDLGLVNLNSSQSLNPGATYIINSVAAVYSLEDNTKPFDRYYRSLGIVAKLDVKKASLIPVCNFDCFILKQVNIFQNWALKNYSQTFCQDNYLILQLTGSKGCQDGYALSLGLTLGEDGYFTKELKTSFKKLGLTHLTAFSGMQTVLILALTEMLLNTGISAS